MALPLLFHRTHLFRRTSPCKRPLYQILTSRALLKRGRNLPRNELELAHDVGVRHAREESPADQMSHSVLRHEAPDLSDALVGTSDDEAVLHEPVQIGHDR